MTEVTTAADRLPDLRTPEDLGTFMLATLRNGDPTQSQANARAMMVASTTFLRDSLGETGTLELLDSLSDAVKAGVDVVRPPEQLADLVLFMLRNRGKRPETHEDARAFIAGAACYLNEAYGAPYAGAVMAGITAAAEQHGAQMRCERPAGVSLH